MLERKHVEAIAHAVSASANRGCLVDCCCPICCATGNVTSAVLEALAACDESPWMPVDGVKDSRAVLLGWSNSNTVAIGSKHYTDAYWKSDAGNRFNVEPTHMMPLPAAPEVDTGPSSLRDNLKAASARAANNADSNTNKGR